MNEGCQPLRRAAHTDLRGYWAEMLDAYGFTCIWGGAEGRRKMLRLIKLIYLSLIDGDIQASIERGQGKFDIQAFKRDLVVAATWLVEPERVIIWRSAKNFYKLRILCTEESSSVLPLNNLNLVSRDFPHYSI